METTVYVVVFPDGVHTFIKLKSAFFCACKRTCTAPTHSLFDAYRKTIFGSGDGVAHIGDTLTHRSVVRKHHAINDRFVE